MNSCIGTMPDGDDLMGCQDPIAGRLPVGQGHPFNGAGRYHLFLGCPAHGRLEEAENVVLHHRPAADLVQGEAQVARLELFGGHLREGFREARQHLFVAEGGSSFLGLSLGFDDGAQDRRNRGKRGYAAGRRLDAELNFWAVRWWCIAKAISHWGNTGATVFALTHGTSWRSMERPETI